MPDPEEAVRAAVEQLADALLASLRAEQVRDPDAPERLVSIDQACELLSLGRSSVYEEIGAGRLRSVTARRRRLIPMSAIRDYINGTER